MLKRQPFWRFLAVGVIFAMFLINYQPSLSIPPLKSAQAKADFEQTQEVIASTLGLEFQLPHPGYLSTPYSHYHPGVDLATGLGMPIKPIAPGKVVESGLNFWGLGLVVVVAHDQGFKSLYAHLGRTYVRKNQLVKDNDFLGEVGLTGATSGPHTHLEITKEGRYLDPLTLLPQVRSYPLAQDFQPVGQGGKKLP